MCENFNLAARRGLRLSSENRAIQVLAGRGGDRLAELIGRNEANSEHTLFRFARAATEGVGTPRCCHAQAGRSALLRCHGGYSWRVRPTLCGFAFEN